MSTTTPDNSSNAPNFLDIYIKTKNQAGKSPKQMASLNSIKLQLAGINNLEEYIEKLELQNELKGIFGEFATLMTLNMLLLENYTLELTDAFDDTGYKQDGGAYTKNRQKKNKEIPNGDIKITDITTGETALIDITTRKSLDISYKYNTSMLMIVLDLGDGFRNTHVFDFFKGTNPVGIVTEFESQIKKSIVKSINQWSMMSTHEDNSNLLARFCNEVLANISID